MLPVLYQRHKPVKPNCLSKALRRRRRVSGWLPAVRVASRPTVSSHWPTGPTVCSHWWGDPLEHPGRPASSRPTTFPNCVPGLHNVYWLPGERPAPATIDRQAREALAGRQIDITLKALAEAGVTACYHSCDLSVPDQVRQTVAAVEREHGAVSALIHGAGTLADRLIVDKTRDELNRVFATKLSGLKNLLDTLHVPTLSHVALFSSAAAFFGNPGQADYAMANEVLNRVARARWHRLRPQRW